MVEIQGSCRNVEMGQQQNSIMGIEWAHNKTLHLTGISSAYAGYIQASAAGPSCSAPNDADKVLQIPAYFSPAMAVVMQGKERAMTDHKGGMLAIFRGDTPGGILFVPRLDIWYNRNKTRSTLPPGYENLSLRGVALKLGVGHHSVVPDFIRSAPTEDMHHRALGFYNNPQFPFTVDFSGVEYDVQQSENELKVIYHSKHGDITTRCSFGRDLFDSGSSIPDILEYAVKKREDYAGVADILSKVRVYPTPDKFQAYYDRVGNAGVAVAFLSLACGPMHHIMRDLRKFEEFCLDLYDEPSIFARCAEPLAELYEQIIDSVLQTTAEVVLFGANYDETITYRPFFEEHLAPWLNKAADRMHSAGKYLLTHTDGENKGLLPAFGVCRFDIADSICPAPMTKVSLQEYREFFAARTTIWGGIPSRIMLRSCCTDADFECFVQGVIQNCKPYDHLILSIADTVPPDADFDRIMYIAQKCEKTWPP